MAKKATKKKTTKKSKKTAKKGGFFNRLFKTTLKWGFVLGLWGLIVVAGIVIWFASELPNITKDMVFERRPTIIIQDAKGNIIDRYGDVKGEIVDVKDLPSHVTNAVLAIEDRRFYDHYGMDPKGIARAFTVNIKKGGFVQGGSTITQQLAKNLFLSRDRKIKRKIQELILAFQLEYELSKDEILSAYLNRVYLGSGAYGIDAAARVYFNKSAKELNVREAATIAGLLKAPSRYSPSNNPELSAKRTQTVLNAMIAAGYVTESDVDKMAKLPPAPRRKPSSGNTIRYFTDYVVSQLNDLIGTIEEDIIVQTTINSTIQQEMEESMTKALLQYGKDHNVTQGAGVMIRLDGAIVAMLGGRDYGTSEFNRVTDSLRSPGSSFKPIVYLAALENGWRMDDVIIDEKITRGRYRPQNFGHKYYGPVSLYEALTLSLNTVAVNLMRDVGPDATISLARRLGITADLEPNLSLALGSSGVPMIQMATAYSILARNGSAVEPYSIRKVTTEAGKTLYKYKAPTKERQIVARQNTGQIIHMMRSVVENGTGRGAMLPYPAAGKTGTSQDFRDAWFAGFTSKYAGIIWMGNDDNSETKRLTGGSAPARVWREVMTKAYEQGGKSYTAFGTYAPTDNFEDILADILSNDPEYRGNRQGGGFFSWFSPSAGDEIEIEHLNRKGEPSYKPSSNVDTSGAPTGQNNRGRPSEHQWKINE